MTKDVINEDMDWRHKREKCPECGKITMYRMPIVTHVCRCSNPECEVGGF